MKKKSILIIVIVIVSILVLGIVAFFILGNKFLEIVVDDSSVKEIYYKAEEFAPQEAKCKFFNKTLSRNKVKVTKTIDVTKLGEQNLEYTCKQWMFTKTKSVTYKVVDKEAPVITINGSKEMTLYIGSKYEDQGVKVTDNVDGDITDKVSKTGEVDTSKEGTYEIVYKISDSSNNESTETRKVTVKKKQVADLSCGKANTIYLTFDDGPNSYYTPVILDVLKKYNIKATFFVTSAGPDELIKREFDEGHVIALHSSSHAYDKIYRSSEAFWNDINTVSSRVERITGQKSYLIRFPGGSSNTISRHYKLGIMAQLAKEVEERGYAYFDWNISSGDAGETTDPNVELNYVISGLSKSRGNVILMHDIKKHTSIAIENIIKYGLDRGYKFDVLDKSITCHQRIAN